MSERYWFEEIWLRIRDYWIAILSDALIAGLVWAVSYGFQILTIKFPVDGWAGLYIEFIYATGSIIALTLFVVFSIVDIRRIREALH